MDMMSVVCCCDVVLCCDVILCIFSLFFFFFKQKTAYEMRISDWSSDVCSSDLGLGGDLGAGIGFLFGDAPVTQVVERDRRAGHRADDMIARAQHPKAVGHIVEPGGAGGVRHQHGQSLAWKCPQRHNNDGWSGFLPARSEEHTSELQSLMRNSYAVFCLQK